MTLTWTRALGWRRCGLCGTDIPAGAAVLTVVLRSTTKLRCASCAGSPAPDLDLLPPVGKRPPVTLGPWPGPPAGEPTKQGEHG